MAVSTDRDDVKRLVIFAILAVMALLVGAWHARALSFVNDDAFISFRYAQHLVEGKGLTFNEGERVEGYTNFLWTVVLAGGMKIGLDPVPFSETMGITFYLLTLGLCAVLGWKLLSRKHGNIVGVTGFMIPITALALSVHRDFNVYATSGMETSMFTFLAFLAFTILATADSDLSFLTLGIAFVLLLLTRPDGVVFLGAAAVYVFLMRHKSMRRFLIMVIPLVVLYVPYWLWRFTYYGYVFPNTFYAKSIDDAAYQNGAAYVWLYLKSYYAIPVALYLAVAGSWGMLMQFRKERLPDIVKHGLEHASLRGRALFLAILFITTWVLFIVRIGGDFMFARFLIPVTPLLYFIVELLLPSIPARIVPVLCVFVIATTYFRYDQFTNRDRVGYIADEWKYYPEHRLRQNRADGLKLKKYFTNIPLKVGFGGTQAQLIYYADPPLAIECTTGLTDTFVAHQTITERGRPGHEKPAPLSYLTQRGVNFLLWDKDRSAHETFVSDISFDGLQLPVLVYDNTIMDSFASDSSVHYASVPRLLDALLDSVSNYSTENLQESYALLKQYYFDHNRDPGREQALLAALQQRAHGNGTLSVPRANSTR